MSRKEKYTDVPKNEADCFRQDVQWQQAIPSGFDDGVRNLMYPHSQLTGSPLSSSAMVEV